MPQPPKRTTGAGRGAVPPGKREPRSPEDDTIETPEEQAVPLGGSRVSEEGIPSEEASMAIRKALVIGIDDYGGAPNNLPSCVNDANAFTRLLKSTYKFNEIHTVTNADATSARVDEELGWLVKNAGSDDRLVLYFSGHGYTKLANGVAEECLVLRDGPFEGARLIERTTELPPATLTVIVDACFSGGAEQFVFDPTGATPDVEVARVKAWTQTGEEKVRDRTVDKVAQQRITELRRFGCAPVTSREAIGKIFASATHRSLAQQPGSIPALGAAWQSPTAVATNGAGQLELNGLLIVACVETETAAASTSKTNGLSAFTYALLASVERLSSSAVVGQVLSGTERTLKTLGFRQTPRLLERGVTGDLRLRRFITLEPATVAESLGHMSEPGFWEGVLTAMAPQISALRAVAIKEGDLMSTMFHPMTGGAYQTGFGSYQPTFGTNFPPSDDIQRLAPVLGPILANVIPAIVPQIVNSIIAQQRVLGTGFAPGGYQQFGVGNLSGVDDVQRLLPVLAPVLAAVIPAVVPQIVNAVLSQQRTTTPWLQQQFTQPYGSQGGQQFGQQFGQQTDLWHTVNQSVNDTLQKFAQTPAFAGRV